MSAIATRRSPSASRRRHAALCRSRAISTRPGAPHRSGPTIALIYATGLIARGGGGGEQSAHRRRRHVGRRGDPRLPPGGATTSRARHPLPHRQPRRLGGRLGDDLARAVARAEAGKPVIVSMGDVAGSGGYYIAAPADKIVAEPATLTGSIGVVAGKLAVGGLLKKLGGNSDAVQIGANAGMFSLARGFLARRARAASSALLDDIYGELQGARRRKAASSTPMRSRRSPRGASGPARTPRQAASSMRSAASTRRWRWRSRRPGCRRTRT